MFPRQDLRITAPAVYGNINFNFISITLFPYPVNTYIKGFCQKAKAPILNWLLL